MPYFFKDLVGKEKAMELINGRCKNNFISFSAKVIWF